MDTLLDDNIEHFVSLPTTTTTVFEKCGEEIESIMTIAIVIQGKISDLKENKNKGWIPEVEDNEEEDYLVGERFDIFTSVLPKEALRLMFKHAWVEGLGSFGDDANPDVDAADYWKGSTVYKKSDKRLKEALDTLYIKAWVKGRFSTLLENQTSKRLDDEVALMETILWGETIKMLEKQFPFKH